MSTRKPGQDEDSRPFRSVPLPLCPASYTKIRPSPLPDLPPEDWCDFRIDYEAGMTLKEIARKYMCDPRTVRKCIRLNQSSTEIGRQNAPTKLTHWIESIDSLYAEYSQINPAPGICRMSSLITERLKALGYTGSERTVRNYLRVKYQSLSRLH